MISTELFTPQVYEAEGEVIINKEKISYKSICEDNVIYDEKGEMLGNMFTYSYFRKNIESSEERPVMFFFNGGPGSGSLWLHVGLFGPLRLKFETKDSVNVPAIPPYKVENNDLCMLDVCDLVFIDPVGTGYGRLLNKEASKKFYSMDGDAESFKALIHRWLNKYNRWMSPKYLLGESYGTIRAGLLSDLLTGRGENLSPVGLNGIVLLGNAIGTNNKILEFNAEEALLALPSMAATNWYHNNIGGSLEDFVNSCYEFCENEYVLALFAGNTLDEDTKLKIGEKVSYFSGLDIDEVLRQDLRPDMPLYWQQLLKDEGLELGRLDSRYTLPFGSRTGEEGVALTQYTPAFMMAMSGPVKTALNISHNREYYGISGIGKDWKRESEKPANECLAASMRRNRDLKIMFATGYYDMACQIGQAKYLASHSGFPKDRVEINEYPSGHMLYLGEDSAKAFAEDVRNFIL